MNDWELLQKYARHGSESAFQTLVERYLNLVHSVASRQVRDAQLAEEVSQAVFILLARKAARLKERVVLSGWLFRTTRFVAARALRGEQRRQRREQEAYEMQTLTTSDENWRRIEPKLDEALEKLGAAERDLLLLRFYEGRNHKEAGSALGLSEEAARKRGARALEKLRHWFAGRGIALTVAGLAAALAGHAVQAAPVGLGACVLTAARSTTSTTLPGLAGETLKAWRLAKARLIAIWVGAGVGIALLLGSVAQHLKSQEGTAAYGTAPAKVGSTGVGNGVLKGTIGSSAKTADKKRSGALRFHVVAKDSGEPVAGARLAIVRIPNFEQTYDQSTDDNGVCEIPLTSGLMRLDVGVLSPGWGARFATLRQSEDNPIPAEYTLRIERVTNSVGGWLRDPDGKPVSGATVWVEFVGTGDASWRETPRERVGVMLEAPVATSDNEGHWSCSVIPTENPGFSLQAKHPDFAATAIASSYPWQSPDQKGQEKLQQLWSGTLVTKLGQALEIKGRVMDEKGQPIAGARAGHHPNSSIALQFKTDARGEFLIPKLKAGKFDFAVSADGFAPEYREVDVQPGLEPLAIVLKPGAVLRLRLQDEAGTAVRGTEVILEQWGEQRNALDWRARSDDDGRIEWKSAPRGRLELCARKDGWCFTRGVIVTADGEERVITMTPALTLDGYVTDAETGAAIESFKVLPGFGEGRGEQVWHRNDTRQGLHGKFSLVFDETQQPWQLQVEADGYEPLISGVPPNYLGRYDVALKRADPNMGIRGVVLLPNGAPAAGASVALLSLDYGATLRPGGFLEQGYGNLAKTDAAGRFTFVANPRAHSVAAVSAAGFVKKRVTNAAEPVTLKLQPWGSIEGTVAEAARSRPIEWLTLEDETSWNYRGSVAPDINAFQAKPDANGHFVFNQAPAGWLSIYINRRMGTPMVCRTEVEVRPGETARVTVGGTGRTVTGRFVLPADNPEIWERPETYATLNPKGPRLPPPGQPRGDEAGLWAVDFWQSPAARDYNERNRAFSLTVETNGSFSAEGVLPGAYELLVIAERASLKKEVIIPEADSGEEVVELGTLAVTKP